MPHFQACQPAPPSSSPPASESLFAMCCISKLTNLLHPFPPLQQVSPRSRCPIDPSSPSLQLIYLLFSPTAMVPAKSVSQNHLADPFEAALRPPPSETPPLRPSRGIHD